MPYIADPEHLAALIEGARIDARRQTLRGQRLAMFQVLDFYTGTLHEAAGAVGRNTKNLQIGDLVNVVLTYIPGLKLDWLHGLRPLRNQLAHDDLWSPSAETLAMYLDRAEDVRAVLQKASGDAADRLAALSPLAREFLEFAEGMSNHLLTRPAPERENSQEHIAWAEQRARQAPETYTQEDIARLLASVKLLVHLRTISELQEEENWEPSDEDPGDPSDWYEPSDVPRDDEFD